MPHMVCGNCCCASKNHRTLNDVRAPSDNFSIADEMRDWFQVFKIEDIQYLANIWAGIDEKRSTICQV
jgi:hypothetical protein